MATAAPQACSAPANTAPALTNVVLGETITYTAVDAEMNALTLRTIIGGSNLTLTHHWHCAQLHLHPNVLYISLCRDTRSF